MWGDGLVAAAFGDMWNLAISIITPISKTPINLFHNKSVPDVVNIANGGCWTSATSGSTHFSATSSKDPDHKLPGTEYKNLTIAMDKAPKLDPHILSDKEKAKQIAIKEYMKQEKEKSLKLLRNVAKTIDWLNGKIVEKIGEVDELVEEKKQIEHKLNVLGVSATKIEDYGMMAARQYVTMEEREKSDRENQAKRKREEEEAEEQRKKMKIIPVDSDGRRRVSFEEKVDVVISEEVTEPSVTETGKETGKESVKGSAKESHEEIRA